MIYSARRRYLCFGRGPIVVDTESEMGPKDLEQAVQHLRNGGVVAIPTDTLYGLAACALDRTAVERVFRLKGRSQGVPLPLLLAEPGDIFRYAVDIPEAARALMERFWPGPSSPRPSSPGPEWG